jgi:ubiquinone/menaquinone biosynthesis C-methylase UbiE
MMLQSWHQDKHMADEDEKHYLFHHPENRHCMSTNNMIERDPQCEAKRGKGIWKRFTDSKFGWSLIEGPFYNRLIIKASSGGYQRIVDRLSPPDNTRILDVGSGPGYVSLMLAAQYPTVSVTGVDYSRTQVRFANRLRTRKGITNCEFIQGNAMELPLEDGSFDIVISVGSIKFWPDKVRGLREIKRVLVPNGLAFIVESDAGFEEKEFDRYASRFDAWYVSSYFVKKHMRLVFSQSITTKEAERIADTAGFEHKFVAKVPEEPLFAMLLHT